MDVQPSSQTRLVDLSGTPGHISRAEQLISDVLAEAENLALSLIGSTMHLNLVLSNSRCKLLTTRNPSAAWLRVRFATTSLPLVSIDGSPSARSYSEVAASPRSLAPTTRQQAATPPRADPPAPPAAGVRRVPATARLGPRSEVHRVEHAGVAAEVDQDGFEPRQKRRRFPARHRAKPPSLAAAALACEVAGLARFARLSPPFEIALATHATPLRLPATNPGNAQTAATPATRLLARSPRSSIDAAFAAPDNEVATSLKAPLNAKEAATPSPTHPPLLRLVCAGCRPWLASDHGRRCTGWNTRELRLRSTRMGSSFIRNRRAPSAAA
ncbi:hypothetical protein ZWY2020_037908 [Hordeum vulgare]|nr:hypothetical protein ZWY2020_037908 [Hordeum vulgare]